MVSGSRPLHHVRHTHTFLTSSVRGVHRRLHENGASGKVSDEPDFCHSVFFCRLLPPFPFFPLITTTSVTNKTQQPCAVGHYCPHVTQRHNHVCHADARTSCQSTLLQNRASNRATSCLKLCVIWFSDCRAHRMPRWLSSQKMEVVRSLLADDPVHCCLLNALHVAPHRNRCTCQCHVV